MATIPQPLWYRGDDNLQVMTSTDITNVINQAISVYSRNPSVVLALSSVTGDSDDLGPLTDTRLRSGAASRSVSTYPSEATTEEPTTVTTNYYLSQTVSDSDQPVEPLPLYRNADGTIQSMTPNDFTDTFIKPAIDFMTDSNNFGTTSSGGIYRIHTTQSLTDHTIVDSAVAFQDTRANTASFSAGNIGTSGTYQDFPTTINSYYLMKTNGPETDPDASSVVCGAFRRSDGNVQAYSLTSWNRVLEKYMRYTAASTSGYQIRYSLDSGSISGSGMANTVLSGGTGTYAIRFFNADDYRAQEFPDGTPTTESTKYLRVRKV